MIWEITTQDMEVVLSPSQCVKSYNTVHRSPDLLAGGTIGHQPSLG